MSFLDLLYIIVGGRIHQDRRERKTTRNVRRDLNVHCTSHRHPTGALSMFILLDGAGRSTEPLTVT